ncbi:hypothetical protein BU14_0769s0004 [Porphyra umbilicalis]|uniref:SAP domain-containing protein n=1 Tax=Porphyra umbilicalis TaxID=2786 RepID=A0A1X6NP85_PORUM|nr:hypothetical protein BU14_0769s0004 [Porphyra umbilicalis]|eukprot:OSX70397.1 hypothetical protein BU14_0769s0004 [Porphyra umbilicalis]
MPAALVLPTTARGGRPSTTASAASCVCRRPTGGTCIPSSHRRPDARLLAAGRAAAAAAAAGPGGRRGRRPTMVEGHAVQRLATAHRAQLLRRAFRAESPNGRFAAGAAAIDGRVLVRVEAAGDGGRRRRPTAAAVAAAAAAAADAADAAAADADAAAVAADAAALAAEEVVVVHIHFGMSGQFRTAGGGRPVPDARPTTRLRLMELDAAGGAPRTDGLVGLVSAQLLVAGGPALYADAVRRLGPDPLRGDAVASRFLDTLASTDRSVGAVLMDQSAVAGVGNIFRSEICHKARVHPDEPGRRLSPATAAAVWAHTVDLLQRGYLDGAIVTTDGAVAAAGRRRYVYNEAVCVCGARVQTWAIATRTAYACLACQPRLRGGGAAADAAGAAAAATAAAPPAPPPAGACDAVVFPSACAPDSGAGLLAAPGKMRVAQLRAALAERGAPTDGTKPALVARLVAATAARGPAGGGKADAPAAVAASPAATPRRGRRGRRPAADAAGRPPPAAAPAAAAAHAGAPAAPLHAPPPVVGTAHLPPPTGAALAAAFKAAVGEPRTFEHVAEAVAAAAAETAAAAAAAVAAAAAAPPPRRRRGVKAEAAAVAAPAAETDVDATRPPPGAAPPGRRRSSRLSAGGGGGGEPPPPSGGEAAPDVATESASAAAAPAVGRSKRRASGVPARTPGRASSRRRTA